MAAINVLIVEDEAIFAEVLKTFLIEKKLNVRGVFDNVREALDFINENSVDFVFIDIYLRGKENGIELSKELKKMDIPFMFITAISDEKTMELAKKEGSYGYIIKPIDLSQLGISIDLAITQAQAHKRLKKEKRNIENKLRDMLDTLQVMLVELSLDYEIKFMTNLVREKFNINSLWSKNFLDFFGEKEKKVILDRLERVKSGEVITLNTVMNNGEKNFPVFFRFLPMIEEDDGVFDIIGIRILIINIMDIITEFVMPDEEFFKEYSLSEREMEIVKYIIKFQSNNEIAKNLYISIPTVKFHIKNIYAKLKVKNRKELIEKLKNYYYKNFGNECYSMYLLNILLEN